jgi:hypothetical protein
MALEGFGEIDPRRLAPDLSGPFRRRQAETPPLAPGCRVPSGFELTQELAAQLKIRRAVVGLIEDMEILVAQADAAQAISAMAHARAANQIRGAIAVSRVRAMLAR